MYLMDSNLPIAALQIQGLVKIYGKGGNSVTALDDVSLTVNQGEFVAIVGASGSGKSTLMHLAGGVDRPDSGRVVIGGTDIQTLSESDLAIFRRRNLGIVYQAYNLIPTLTAEENIMLPFLLDNRIPEPGKLNELLTTFGLVDRAKHLPSELSGGQQQRVAIARALINDPAVILADEPTGNLDSKTSREVLDLLKHANRKYFQTLVIITHDLDIAQQADRVIEMSDGHVVRDEVLIR